MLRSLGGREIFCFEGEEGVMEPVMAAMAARERGTESFLERLWTFRRCDGRAEGVSSGKLRLWSRPRGWPTVFSWPGPSTCWWMSLLADGLASGWSSWPRCCLAFLSYDRTRAVIVLPLRKAAWPWILAAPPSPSSKRDW